MPTRAVRPLLRLVAAIVLPLLIAALFTPLALTAADGPQAPAATLQSGVINTSTKTTTFQASTSTEEVGWAFVNNVTDKTAIGATCQIGDGCIAINANASGFGVVALSLNQTPNKVSYGVNASSRGVGPNAAGVYGEVVTSGVVTNTASGVEGRAHSPSGSGVLGRGGGFGVRGFVDPPNASGFGGYFSATTGIGLFASSGSNIAFQAQAGNNIAVKAVSSSNIAVSGQSSGGNAVTGSSVNATGVLGKSNKSTGVVAQTVSGTIALRATNPNKGATNFAAVFDGNVKIAGNYVATGTKSAQVYTTQGDRLMYAEEATQNYFSDMGVATLKDGVAVIKIEPLFAQTVNLSQPYMVFLTPYSDRTGGLAVVNLTADSFEVRELNGGKGSFSFAWRVSALRKGYEKDRMAPAPLVPAPDVISAGD